MRKFLISTLAAAAATATIASTGAYADAAEDTAKARRAFYTLVGFEMGTLGAMAKGAMDYDAETAAQSAKDILTLTGLNTAEIVIMEQHRNQVTLFMKSLVRFRELTQRRYRLLRPARIGRL